MSYSTGEIAELCGVTVRTVQYYDKEGLLKPESFSEGGRREYGENGLKTLQIICMYKQLGLSLAEIKDVISDEANSKKILLSVLAERERALDEEIKQKLSARDSIKIIRGYLSEGAAMPKNSFFDVRTIMKGKRKLMATYATMMCVGILMDLAEIAFIVLWAVKGLWLPFAIGMPCVVLIAIALIAMYYRNVQYICTNCGKKFKPKVREWLFSKHTMKTHKLTCPHCGTKNFHTETYSD
ncbi:MAG TPA: MerR family transcriptional regulator [Clostridiales bacterium]|nr:MerR family transcriptional regulator [Clostridiales bacterium]